MSTTHNARYRLEGKVPGMKGSKHPCPACGKFRQFTRWIDTRTGDLLPDEYGCCNNKGKCGYDLSPYAKGPAGISYADQIRQRDRIPKVWFMLASKLHRSGSSRSTVADALRFQEGASPEQAETVVRYIFGSKPDRQAKSQLPLAKIYTIPDEVFNRSLAHYDRNNFHWLLADHFGRTVAQDLLQRFQIGTSSHWQGACVFWFIDEQYRVRGGQVTKYDLIPGKRYGHKAKYLNRDNEEKTCFTSANDALYWRYEKLNQPVPDWLTEYQAKATRYPILFGQHQLRTAPADMPLAIVEGPATAVFCTPYFPVYVWLAVGALEWLTTERLASVKARTIRLFPDLSKTGIAYQKWAAKAERLRQAGFSVEVDTMLEQQAELEEREESYDLRDYLMKQWPGYPPSWDTPNL